MAIVTKTVLKTYFEQGDIPTQAQYVDLIDSNFGLGEAGNIQTIQGSISADSAVFEYVSLKKLYIPGLGISAEVDIANRKGAKVGSTFIIGKTLEVVGDINTTGIISGSSIESSGNITATGNLTTGTLTAGNTTVGSLVATTLDTGQGANELYDMNQNVKTTSAVTFTTVNTGQGATEVHLMNQNVKTTNNVQFANIIGNSVTAQTGITVSLGEHQQVNWSSGGIISTSKRKFSIKFSNLPPIKKGSSFSEQVMTIANLGIDPAQSVVLVTNSTAFNPQGSQIGIHISNMYEGNFIIKLFHSVGGSNPEIAEGGELQGNFIIL